MTDISRGQTSKNMMVIFVCFIAALAGLLFGMDIGVIAGALPFLAHEFQASSAQQEWIVSSMMFGAAIGAIGNGIFAARLGRKLSLMLGALLFVVGSVGSALAPNPEILIIARIFLGLAVGVASYTAPIYLSEMAPERIRGGMISMYQLMVATGVLLAYISDTWLSYSGAWRWMLGVIAFPSGVLFLCVLFMPESPRWLATRGRLDEAEKVLNRLNDTPQQVQREMDDIRDSLKVKQQGLALVLSNPYVRKVVVLGIILQCMQQFTGINVIMYYAPKIFELAGFASTEQQMWGTVIVGIVAAGATFIAIGLVDRWGRRPTLMTGFCVMAAGMGILGLMFHVGIHSTFAQYFAISMLLMFLLGFSMSAGPLIWVLCSEIQPLKSRDIGITCSTATNWIANMIVGFTFLTMLDSLGSAATFWLYAFLLIVFVLLTFLLVPETKNISLENIERNLFKGKPLRELGQPVSNVSLSTNTPQA
ncbi:TPA: sugar porter family MFS transporter [Klebsiella pneumoniae]